jgi:hypothetical protein
MKARSGDEDCTARFIGPYLMGALGPALELVAVGLEYGPHFVISHKMVFDAFW